MFDLEKAIADWNKSLRRANAVQDGDRAELEGYLRELRAIVLAGMADYLQVEKKRACERLRQIAVESAIGISNLCF